MSTTVGELASRVFASLDALVTVAAPVEEEWQYVEDLRTVWRARVAAVTAARSGEPAPDETVAAIDTLARAASAIDDPHRAIDWLSTLPQVALLAFGEPPS